MPKKKKQKKLGDGIEGFMNWQKDMDEFFEGISRKITNGPIQPIIPLDSNSVLEWAKYQDWISRSSLHAEENDDPA